jgi:hypothetical protein
MLCTQRPPWISDPDISNNSPVFPSILIINSLQQTDHHGHPGGQQLQVICFYHSLQCTLGGFSFQSENDCQCCGARAGAAYSRAGVVMLCSEIFFQVVYLITHVSQNLCTQGKICNKLTSAYYILQCLLHM